MKPQRFPAIGRFLPLALALSFGGLGCSSDSEEASESCRKDGVDYTVTGKEIEHSCSHGTDGPFGSLQDGEEVANLHTFYTLALTEDSPGSFVGTFSLTARATATHSFYWSAPIEVTYAVAGSNRCVAHVEQTPTCSDFVRVDLVDLTDKETVTIQVGATSEASLNLVAERR